MKARVLAVGVAVILLLPDRPRTQELESLTVALMPGAVDFTLTHNSPTNAGSTTITALTSWNLLVTRTNVSLFAYFSSATAALVHTEPASTVDITSSRVEVSVNGGPRTPFDQTVVFGAPNAGRQIFSQAINLGNLNSSRSDVLSFNINLSVYPLPADTYTGVLRFRAQATP